MNINDPRINQMLQELDQEKKSNFKSNKKYDKKTKSYIYKLEELSNEPCEHERPYSKCLVCVAKDNDVSTDHKIAKVLYARFCPLFRICRGIDDDINTNEIMKKHHEEILKNWPGMLRTKKATYYDTMIYFADHMTENLDTDTNYRIWLYLASKFYDVKKLTSSNIPWLTEDEKKKLENYRGFIFSRQISKLKDDIKYQRWYNGNV